MIKKELIGWTILGKYYKVNSMFKAIALSKMDFLGKIIPKNKEVPKNPKEILVVRLEHLGDMVLTSVFINNLRKNYPKAKITVLCRESSKVIAEMIDEIDEIITLNVPWSCREKNCLSWKEVKKFIKKNKKKYDLGFDLFFDPRNIYLMSKLSKYSVGYGVRGFGFLLNKNVEWESKDKHIVSRQLDMLRALKLKVKEENVPLKLNKKELETFKKKFPKIKNFVVANLSAGTTSKEYPLELWKKLLLNKLKTEVIVSAEIDKNKISYLKKNINNKNFHILNLSIKEYIYLIYLCKELISVDTFAVHVASCFSKKILGLYSGTNLAEEWGPYMNKKAKVMQDTTCIHYPCGLKKCVFGEDIPCMRNLKI